MMMLLLLVVVVVSEIGVVSETIAGPAAGWREVRPILSSSSASLASLSLWMVKGGVAGVLLQQHHLNLDHC